MRLVFFGLSCCLLTRQPIRQIMSRTMTDDQFTKLSQQISELSRGQTQLTEQVGGLTEQVGGLSGRVDGLTERVDGLTERVDGLTERVDGLSQSQKHLTERVDGLSHGHQQLGKQVNDLSDGFLKLFRHVEKRFDEIRVELDTKATTSQVDSLYQLVDSFAKRFEIDEHERLAIANHQDRQDGWISQLAKKTDTEFVPEM
jgi:uncharacterized protein YoxC